MKKYIPLLLVVFFPYSVVIGFFTGPDRGVLLIGSAMLVSMGLSLGYFLYTLIKKPDIRKLSLACLLIKLLQIPAFVCIYLLGLGSTMVLLVGGFVYIFLLFIMDCIAVAQSGAIMLACVIRAQKENRISKKDAIAYAICSFLFVVDVITCIMLYRKIKEGEK